MSVRYQPNIQSPGGQLESSPNQHASSGLPYHNSQGRMGFPFIEGAMGDRHTRAPRLPPPFSSQHRTPYGSAPDAPYHDVSVCIETFFRFSPRSDTVATTQLVPPRSTHRHHHHRHHASTNIVPTHTQYRSMLDIDTPMHAAQPPPPRPPLPEEDECPICHEALPPKGPDGSETAREAHVSTCIETHFSSSKKPKPPTVASSAAPPLAPLASTSSLRGPLTTTAGGVVVIRPEVAHAASEPAVMPRRRTTGMVVYHASEKDCVGVNGEDDGQECVICFEEFTAGDEMGRLECLCKFHKVSSFFPPLSVCQLFTLCFFLGKEPHLSFLLVFFEQTCIRQWWDAKGVGACPVHQDGL